MTKDDAWNLVDMMESYFSNLADADDGQPNKEMEFAQACEELMNFLEKLP